MSSHYQVLVIGAGTAGLMVASQLHKKSPNTKIAIIDTADTH